MHIMKKTLIVLLISGIFIAIFGWYLMTDIRINRNCSSYSDEKFAELMRQLDEEVKVPQAVNPVMVRFSIDPGVRVPANHRFEINAGTASIFPPHYTSAEYLGTFKDTLEIQLSNQEDEWPLSPTLDFSLYLPEQKAVCIWASELGSKIPDRKKIYHYHFQLLPYRRTDYMSGYNITRID